MFYCSGRHMVIFPIPEVSWICHWCIQNVSLTRAPRLKSQIGANWTALMAVWTQGSPAYPVHCEAQNTSFPFVSQLNCSALHSCEADCLTLQTDNSLCQASVNLKKKLDCIQSSDSCLLPSFTTFCYRLSCIICCLWSCT